MKLQKGPMVVQGYGSHREEVHAAIGLSFTLGFANFKCMVLVHYKKLPVYNDFLVGLVSLTSGLMTFICPIIKVEIMEVKLFI